MFEKKTVILFSYSLESIGGSEVFLLRLYEQLKDAYNFLFVSTRFNPTLAFPNQIKVDSSEIVSQIEEIVTRNKSSHILFNDYTPGITNSIIHKLKADYSEVTTLFVSHFLSVLCMKSSLYKEENVICDGKYKKLRCTACAFKYKSSNKLLNTLAQFKLTALPLLALNAHRITEEKIMALKKVDKVLCFNTQSKEIYKSNGISNDAIQIIQQLADNSLKPIEKKQGDKIRIYYCGRATYLKGIDVILNLFKHNKWLFDKFEMTVYAISGIDMQYKAYKKACTELGILWYEDLSNEELNKKIQNEDILLFPSRYDNSPLVIWDAIQLQQFIISSDLPNLEEIIQAYKAGITFELNNIVKLANTLKVLDYYALSKHSEKAMQLKENAFDIFNNE